MERTELFKMVEIIFQGGINNGKSRNGETSIGNKE